MVIDQLVCRNRGFRNTMENEERESDYLELPGSDSFNVLQVRMSVSCVLELTRLSPVS